MGLQRVELNWVNELNWTELKVPFKLNFPVQLYSMFRNLFYILSKIKLSQEPYGTKYIFYKLHFTLMNYLSRLKYK